MSTQETEPKQENKTKSDSLSGPAQPTSVEKSTRARIVKFLFGEVTRTDQKPASEEGAPRPSQEGEVHVSAFELMTVSGADAESVNEYVAQKAKKKFKTDVGAISEAQFQEILKDKKDFYRWMAKKWIDDEIKKRKKILRVMAEQKTVKIGLTNAKTYESAEAQPEGALLSEMSTSQHRFESEIKDENLKKSKKLVSDLLGLETQHKEMLAVERSRLSSQGFGQEVIEKMMRLFSNTYRHAREQMKAQRQEEIALEFSAKQLELENRKKEIEALEKRVQTQIKSGTKREMVLVASRWGTLLEGLTKRDLRRKSEWLDVEEPLNTGVVDRDEETGNISIDLNRLTRLERKTITDHIDREVDRVIGATHKDAKEGVRQYNLEALFLSKDDMPVASVYLDSLYQSATNTAGNSAERRKLLLRYDTVWSFLAKKGFLEARHLSKELAIKPFYAEIGMKFNNSIFPDVAEKFKQSPSSHDLGNIRRFLEVSPEILDDGSYRGSHYRSREADSILEILEGLKEDKNREVGIDRGEVFKLITIFHTFQKKHYASRFVNRAIILLYEISTQRGKRVSEIPGSPVLPQELQDDFFKDNFRNSGLNRAVAEQMKLHFRNWISDYKDGRERVQLAISKMADTFKNEMIKEFSQTASGLDSNGLVDRFQKGIVNMNTIMATLKEKMQLLEEMAKEVS